MGTRIELGDEVKDILTGFRGVVIAIHSYLNGCNRVSIQPKLKRGKGFESSECFDDQQLKIIKKKVYNTDRKTGGPTKYADTGY